MSDYCIICVEPIDGHERLQALGPCNHGPVCSVCMYRQRRLTRDQTCCMCKQDVERVVCVPAGGQFSDVETWGDQAGPGFTFDDKASMFFPTAYFQRQIAPLSKPKCAVCRKKFGTEAGLVQHLEQIHARRFCALCRTHRHLFLAEQPTFSEEELAHHEEHGDPSQGWTSHPVCEFDGTRFFGDQELFAHLARDHFECDVCRGRGRRDQYYATYEELEQHWFEAGRHFACNEPECREARFVVFSNAIDLQAHRVTAHPHLGESRGLQLNFTVRRDTAPGADGADESDADVAVLQQQAQDVEDREAFPELSESAAAAGGGGSWMGRGGGGGGGRAPRPEDFPALGGPQQPRRTNTVDRSARVGNSYSQRVTPAAVRIAQAMDPSYPRRQPRRAPAPAPAPAPPNPAADPTPAEAAGRGVVARVREALVDAGEIRTLQSLSAEVRAGQLRADEYMARAVPLFKSTEAFAALFPELAGLLPDERLRDELMREYRRFVHALGSARGPGAGVGAGAGAGARGPAPAAASNWAGATRGGGGRGGGRGGRGGGRPAAPQQRRTGSWAPQRRGNPPVAAAPAASRQDFPGLPQPGPRVGRQIHLQQQYRRAAPTPGASWGAPPPAPPPAAAAAAPEGPPLSQREQNRRQKKAQKKARAKKANADLRSMAFKFG